jgi:hypothetical protein
MEDRCGPATARSFEKMNPKKPLKYEPYETVLPPHCSILPGSLATCAGMHG